MKPWLKPPSAFATRGYVRATFESKLTIRIEQVPTMSINFRSQSLCFSGDFT